jgi:hypothetical protein
MRYRGRGLESISAVVRSRSLEIGILLSPTRGLDTETAQNVLGHASGNRTFAHDNPLDAVSLEISQFRFAMCARYGVYTRIELARDFKDSSHLKAIQQCDDQGPRMLDVCSLKYIPRSGITIHARNRSLL